jgi:hypothetical protein
MKSWVNSLCSISRIDALLPYLSSVGILMNQDPNASPYPNAQWVYLKSKLEHFYAAPETPAPYATSS